MKTAQDPWEEPGLDRFSELCLKALQKVESVKMKTNVLGLNIPLEEFDQIYSSMKGCFTKDSARIESTIRELANIMTSSLRLTYIHCMRACNSIVLSIRKNHHAEDLEKQIKVVPYNKFDEQRQRIEERFLAYRKMRPKEREDHESQYYEEVSTLLSAVRKEEAETFEGFGDRSNDYYLVQEKPRLAKVYWNVMNKFRVELQQVSDVLYHANCNILTQYAASILHFNQGVAATRSSLLTRMASVPASQFEVKFVKLPGTQQHQPQKYVPRSSVLRNKYQGKKKRVSFSARYYVEKDVCRLVQEQKVSSIPNSTAYPVEVPSCSFGGSDVWEHMVAQGFSNIDEQLLKKFTNMEEDFNGVLSHQQNNVGEPQQQKNTLPLDRKSKSDELKDKEQSKNKGEPPIKADPKNERASKDVQAPKNVEVPKNKGQHTHKGAPRNQGQQTHSSSQRLSNKTIRTRPTKSKDSLTNGMLAFLDSRVSKTEVHRKVTMEVAEEQEEDKQANKQHPVKKHKTLLRDSSEKGDPIKEVDDDFSDISEHERKVKENEVPKKETAPTDSAVPVTPTTSSVVSSTPVVPAPTLEQSISTMAASAQQSPSVAPIIEEQPSAHATFGKPYHSSRQQETNEEISRFNQTAHSRREQETKISLRLENSSESRNKPKPGDGKPVPLTQINREYISEPSISISPFSSLSLQQTPQFRSDAATFGVNSLHNSPELQPQPWHQPSPKQPEKPDKKALIEPTPAVAAQPVQPPSKPKSLFASNKVKETSVKQKESGPQIVIPFKSDIRPSQPTPKPAQNVPQEAMPRSLESMMKKVSLTPSNLYDLYCEYFKLPKDAPTTSESQLYRYGMRVPADLKKLVTPEYREFLWLFLREKLIVNDLPDDDKYVYRGPGVVFATKYSSPRECLEEVRKQLESCKTVFVLDNSIFIYNWSVLTKGLKMIRCRHVFFSYDLQREELEADYDAAFASVFPDQPYNKKQMAVTISQDVTEQQHNEYYAGLLYHFMHGGAHEEDDINEFKPRMKFQHITQDFSILLKKNYMYPSRGASDNSVEILDPDEQQPQHLFGDSDKERQ